MSLNHVSHKFETLQLHAGQEVDLLTDSRAVSIYQTTSSIFKDSKHAAHLFGLREFRNIYTRIMNPTTDVFEKRITALEGGVAASVSASGQTPKFIDLSTILQSGDNFAISSHLYGSTCNPFKVTFKRLNIEERFAANNALANIEAFIDENTKGIYTETIGNPVFVYLTQMNFFLLPSRNFSLMAYLTVNTK